MSALDVRVERVAGEPRAVKMVSVHNLAMKFLPNAAMKDQTDHCIDVPVDVGGMSNTPAPDVHHSGRCIGTRPNRNEQGFDRATEMEKTQMLTSKRVGGEVEYNDGEFAEIQTFGIEGIEENLLLDTIQISLYDTHDTPEEFQRRFPVGMVLDILTTTEVTVADGRSEDKGLV